MLIESTSVAAWSSICRKLLLQMVTSLMLSTGFSFRMLSRRSWSPSRFFVTLTTFLKGSIKVISSVLADFLLLTTMKGALGWVGWEEFILLPVFSLGMEGILVCE